jgi:antitoxin component YwqK of YwqJK toxin-antitoxin module
MDVNDHREEGHYVDGERHGNWIHTYPNGIEQFKGEFEMGFPTGKHVYKGYNGSTERVERYNLGQREGKWLYYGPNQTLYQTLEYKRGELIRINGKRIKPTEG